MPKRSGSRSPLDYVFYCILNTNHKMNQGESATLIARSLIALHGQLDYDTITSTYLDNWYKSGENIVILKGYDHKHLKYLKEEVDFLGLDTHVLFQRWSRETYILVLSVFGLQQDLEEIFDGLEPLQ